MKHSPYIPKFPLRMFPRIREKNFQEKNISKLNQNKNALAIVLIRASGLGAPLTNRELREHILVPCG